MKKNVAGQYLSVALINATTGAALTGATVACRRNLDGTDAAVTGSITEPNSDGKYLLALSQADTNGDNCSYYFTASGGVPVCINIHTSYPQTADVASGVNVIQISGDATAADNLEAQFDGTGLTGDTYPATQDQVSVLALQTSVDDLEGRLTAARAGYLDNLNTGVTIRGYSDGTNYTYFKQFTMPSSETGLTTVTPGSTGWARYAGSILMGNAIGAYRILSATDTTLTLDRALLSGGLACVIIPDNFAEITALNNLSAAQVNAEVVDALTVDVIADSVAADGSRPTIAQALLMLNRFLMERSVSSTTMTVTKEDGTTAVMTFTLDSATAPTAITRAT